MLVGGHRHTDGLRRIALLLDCECCRRFSDIERHILHKHLGHVGFDTLGIKVGECRNQVTQHGERHLLSAGNLEEVALGKRGNGCQLANASAIRPNGGQHCINNGLFFLLSHIA